MKTKRLKKLMVIMYMKEMLILMNTILYSEMKEKDIQQSFLIYLILKFTLRQSQHIIY